MSAALFTKSKRYRNLFRNVKSETFHFRKYSKEKGRQFFRSTGEKENEARAYKIGLELFNDWLGKVNEADGTILFRKFGRQYLDRKLDNPKIKEKTKKRFRGELEPSLAPSGREDIARPRLLDFFGHLPIEKVDDDAWERFVAAVVKVNPKFRFFNARKALREILKDAYDKRYIDRVPNLEISREDAAPPRELTRDEIRRLFKHAYFVPKVRGPGGTLVPQRDRNGRLVRRRGWIKLLMYIFWKQGARPTEILQYEWDMFRFDEGKHGKLYIPGRITKTGRSRVIVLNPQVSRLLRFLRSRQPAAKFLFPSDENPERPSLYYLKPWEAVCARAGFDAQLYWFRDTFVTRKIHQLVPLIFIADYIDSSVEMLEGKYAVVGEHAQETVAK